MYNCWYLSFPTAKPSYDYFFHATDPWSCLCASFLKAITLPSNTFLSDSSSQNQFFVLANKET